MKKFYPTQDPDGTWSVKLPYGEHVVRGFISSDAALAAFDVIEEFAKFHYEIMQTE